jgi:DNA-binding CsgD family transcriptional regulator
MATTQTQRIVDLAHGGHGISEIANLMGVSENTIRGALQNLSNVAAGLTAPGTLNQRAVDLAYAGHPVSEVANLLGVSENTVRGLLQDVNQTPSQAETALTGASQTAAPAAGGGSALPATPAGYVTVRINGTDRKLPYY